MNDTAFWIIIVLGIIISSIIQGWIYGKIFRAIKKWFTDRK